MAKIFRFSGYFVDADTITYDKQGFELDLLDAIANKFFRQCVRYALQQFHVEASDDFTPNGELDENCDLALLTRHFKHLDRNVEYDRPLPIPGQKYRHFKIGKIITVLGISRHTESEEVTVVYQYEDKIWNRPLDMFMSEVDRDKYPDAEQKYRFELVEE